MFTCYNITTDKINREINLTLAGHVAILVLLAMDIVCEKVLVIGTPIYY